MSERSLVRICSQLALLALSGCMLVGYDVGNARLVADAGEPSPKTNDADAVPDPTGSDAGSADSATRGEDGATGPADSATRGEDSATGPADSATRGEDSATGPNDGATSPIDGATDPDDGATSLIDGATDPNDGATSLIDGATSPNDDAQTWDAAHDDDAEILNSADAGGGCVEGPNACGGCTVLPNALGGPCGICGLGQYVCAGSDALSCSGGDARPASTGGVVPIDNFEDGDGRLLTTASLHGEWLTVSDGSFGVINPPVGADVVPAEQGANGTARSGHVSGSGFTLWGAGLAASLNDYGCSYDARAQSGITVFTKGSGPGTFVLSVATRQTVPTFNHGTCIIGCYDHFQVRVPLTSQWTGWKVPWTALSQIGWGTRVPFLPSEILYIQFGFDANTTFEASVDELSFY